MVEIFEYCGKVFRRYPNSTRRSDAVYFKRTVKTGETEWLHRRIYEDSFGCIPDGFHVHHIDGNPSNNNPENLECVSPSEHADRHPHDEEWLSAQNAHLNKIRHLTKEWHSSDLGREWHAKAGKASWKNFEPRQIKCACCGIDFMSKTRRENEIFCSNKCKSLHRRKSGVDNEIRICAQCGAEFSVDKYSKTECCTRSCAMHRRMSKIG